MSNRLFGKATIKVNGKTFQSMPGATLDVGGEKKTTVTTDVGVAGFQTEIIPSKIECQCTFDASSRKADFDFEDATIEFKCDSGQTYVITSGWSLDPMQLGKDGVKLTIEGVPAEEML